MYPIIEFTGSYVDDLATYCNTPAKGEFGLTRGRRLHSYFAKRHACMSVTHCKVNYGL